ncbi:helix-turn-helix domain-containing protein [Henriciella aquimarina]|uniref:helix-turn-helix domain-containing protein n=1 Tax=Henriciella aquimarina TaxID=545261 RepID=UPI000A06FAF3|nr:AraC family transcriptional regulator [Henriciella aquimarina]
MLQPDQPMRGRQGAGESGVRGPAASTWSYTASTSVCVSGGTNYRPSARVETEPLHKGVKLILLLSGQLHCCLPDGDEVFISGPCLCSVVNDGDYLASQAFQPDEILRYIVVSFDQQTGAAFFDGPSRGLGLQAGRTMPRLIRAPIDEALAGLGRQMLTCPMRPDAASLYMAGKGLELAGLAADLLGRNTPDRPAGALSAADMERLEEARHILLTSLDEAPDMPTLARQVGLNIRKLTTGFKARYGMTPSSFLQAARLDAAHRMIAAGEWTVSQAAWRVGYTPAAFSTAFRRRFGIVPSSLRI